MKTKYIIASLALLGVAATSCKDEMDYKEYNVVDREYIIAETGRVGGFMVQLYRAVPYDFGNFNAGAMSACATDEAEYSRLGNSIEDFYNGGWSAANPKSSNWSNMYTAIVAANNFIDNFQELDFPNQVLDPIYAALMHQYHNYVYEARFLRAYYYFVLVRQYGGVPLIDHEIPAAEANSLKRNTSDEIYDFIFKELTAIKDEIIVDYSDLGEFSTGDAETGRADKIAVLALRAHAALYWASPLFNPSNDTERYKIAADYHKELMEQCAAQKKSLANSYSGLWAADNYTKAPLRRELLFCYRYYAKSSDGDNLVETNNYPVGPGIENGNGGACPTQNLVDAYEMKNGKAIDEPGSGYDPKNPYKNRDPRLGFTVAVNGDKWPSYKPATFKLETFYNGANGQPTANATTTGYYLKKLLNGAIDLGPTSGFKLARHTYLNFRYGGALLDYAECLFKATGSADGQLAGHTMTARQCVNTVRGRNGVKMPAITVDGDEFWAKYQNERFVELAFEGHRFWDVRRWKEGSKYFTSITRMHITRERTGGTDEKPVYTLTYTPEKVARQWDEKMNLFPIPQTEIAKNPNLEQNPGW